MILSRIAFVLTVFFAIPVTMGVYLAWPILVLLTLLYVWVNLREIYQRRYTWEYDWIPLIIPVLCIWVAHVWTWKATSSTPSSRGWWQIISPYVFR
jgi:hypothetical protein